MVNLTSKSFLTHRREPTPVKLTYRGGTGPPKNIGIDELSLSVNKIENRYQYQWYPQN